MLAGIGSTIAQGMAFGTGSAVAHRAVDSVMGPRGGQVVEQEQPMAAAEPQQMQLQGACAQDKTMFMNACK